MGERVFGHCEYICVIKWGLVIKMQWKGKRQSKKIKNFLPGVMPGIFMQPPAAEVEGLELFINIITIV